VRKGTRSLSRLDCDQVPSNFSCLFELQIPHLPQYGTGCPSFKYSQPTVQENPEILGRGMHVCMFRFVFRVSDGLCCLLRFGFCVACSSAKIGVAACAFELHC
jgi:hypothetical protein